jgi:exopolysaccharide biosynthesis polyprenyl glycosylphosphotransferase
MFKRFSVNYALFSMAVDGLLTVTALALTDALSVAWLRIVWPENWFYSQGEFIPPPLWPVVVLIWVVVFVSVSVYDPKRNYKAVDEFQNAALAAVFANLILAGMLYLTRRDVSRWLFALFLMLDWALLLGWRVIARMAFRLAKGSARPRRVLVVGAGEVGRRVAEMIGEHSWTGLTLEGYLDDAPDKEARGLPVLGTLDDAARVIQQREIDEVVIALPPRAWEQVNQLVVTLHTLPVDVHVVPDYFALTLWRATAEDLAGVPMVNLRAPALNDYQCLIKRVSDLILGGMLTLLALPVMAMIAIAIKLDSPGPILFKQQRVGENGKLFWMYKFRSMVVDADKIIPQMVKNTADGKVTYKRKNDPRVTRVGRFIRHTSLDELPQLFNVLKGDMSLVGPRPELPWLVELYEPWQRKRFAVPQGITGWWQVNGRSDKEMHLHTDEDLFYIQNYSLWLDIRILLKTPWVALRGRGAY